MRLSVIIAECYTLPSFKNMIKSNGPVTEEWYNYVLEGTVEK